MMQTIVHFLSHLPNLPKLPFFATFVWLAFLASSVDFLIRDMTPPSGLLLLSTIFPIVFVFVLVFSQCDMTPQSGLLSTNISFVFVFVFVFSQCDMTPPSGLLSTIFTFISGARNAATQYRVWHHHPPHTATISSAEINEWCNFAELLVLVRWMFFIFDKMMRGPSKIYTNGKNFRTHSSRTNGLANCGLSPWKCSTRIPKVILQMI